MGSDALRSHALDTQQGTKYCKNINQAAGYSANEGGFIAHAPHKHARKMARVKK
jgi:hypothetical protein